MKHACYHVLLSSDTYVAYSSHEARVRGKGSQAVNKEKEAQNESIVVVASITDTTHACGDEKS
jgi:hypothetical protein